ncbi:hypothetical protein CLV84_2118 [Neolewinella xylanilytica]|uniref:Uncharacterized protein n=1 Tax=Neolewinella xylanilytica TaxID=1514080 RepID=A0A2S6I222_9BACT|nr:hypothetical protein [Neolewinella xylanilytica]PPK85226.1 hypothetical protein CLV84_2118 [Neolewinella xylanilytica]
MPGNDYFGWDSRPVPQAKPGSYRSKYGTGGGENGCSPPASGWITPAASDVAKPTRTRGPWSSWSMPRPCRFTVDRQPWTARQTADMLRHIQANPARFASSLPEALLGPLQSRA